jgi:hypothetical protein
LDATVEATKAFEALRSFRSQFGNVTAELGDGQPALLSFGATEEVPVEISDGVSIHCEQGALIEDMTPKRRRQRGLMSPAEKRRRMDTKEARRIQSFLSEFDVESEEKGALERAEDVLYGAAEQRHSFPPAAETRDGFWLHLGEGPGIDFATSENAGTEAESELQSGGTILSTNPMVSAALVDYACVDLLEPSMYPAIIETAPNVTNAETTGVEIDLHVGAEPENDNKVMMSARVKNVRKVDSMEITVAEPLASPEKKMRRADGVPLVESEAETNAGSAGTGSEEMKSHARRRSDEARARRKAVCKQRQRTRKASSGIQLVIETDSTQEAEEAEGPGKWKILRGSSAT